MGNHRWRLSDMIPNAWFYRLKYMGRTRNQNTRHPRKKKHPPKSSSSSSSIAFPPHQSKTNQTHLLSPKRKSYYFTRHLTPPNPAPKSSDSPRQRHSSKKNRALSPKLVTTPVSAVCSCRTTVDSVWSKPNSTSEDYPTSSLDSSSYPEFDSDRDPDHGVPFDSFDRMVSLSTSCRCRIENDIVINVNKDSSNSKFDGFDPISKLNLRPIITKNPSIDTEQEIEKKMMKNKKNINEPTKHTRREINTSSSSPVRRISVSSSGVRLRTNSPRIASRKLQAHGRKSVSSTSSSSRRSLSESFAVVKSSADPQRDFRESMVEMILENNLRASKDLENLLACYLQLNSDEYHELIIKVFKQIWFDLVDVKLK